MKYALLKEVIQFIEEYEVGNSSDAIEDFTIWLNNKLFVANNKTKNSAHNELLIAFKLLYLNKSLKKQTKSVFSDSKVSSIDEYSFLLHLDYAESLRKMELVEMHNLEAPTGIEIIKRLIKNKFVEEFADEEDRRAKRIKMTRSGIEELKDLKPKIDLIFSNFTGALSLDEKVLVSGVFDKLME